MFKRNQSGNGFHRSGKFITNVFVGMFFPSPIPPAQVEKIHASATEEHNNAVILHKKTHESIAQIEELLGKNKCQL